MDMAEPALKLEETNEVETKALSIVDKAKLVKVVDAPSYTSAGTLWKQIGEMIAEVKGTFDPICDAANKAHKAATAKRAFYLDPLQAAHKAVKQLMSAYDEEQERIRKAEEDRLAAIAREEEEKRRKEEQERLEAERKAEEERLLSEAAEAEKSGDMETAEVLTNAAIESSEQYKETAAAIAQEPVYVPPVVVPKAVPKIQGGPSYQVRWYAEVVDVAALCLAIGTKKPGMSIEFVIGLDRNKITGKISSPALNKMATALKNALNIPGVKSYSKRV
jgi:hypothetical protein